MHRHAQSRLAGTICSKNPATTYMRMGNGLFCISLVAMQPLVLPPASSFVSLEGALLVAVAPGLTVLRRLEADLVPRVRVHHV